MQKRSLKIWAVTILDRNIHFYYDNIGKSYTYICRYVCVCVSVWIIRTKLDIHIHLDPEFF